MPGPGPQPPTDGPFFVLITVTARTPEDVDKLAENFAKGASKALETGAKKFIVGRKVSENAITVFEVRRNKSLVEGRNQNKTKHDKEPLMCIFDEEDHKLIMSMIYI